jgi:hypothetical protein
MWASRFSQLIFLIIQICFSLEPLLLFSTRLIKLQIQVQIWIYFKLQMFFHPVATSLRQYNTQIHKSHTHYTYHTKYSTRWQHHYVNTTHKYTSHIHITHITQNISPGDSITTSVQHTNTHVTYTLHISHKIFHPVIASLRQYNTQIHKSHTHYTKTNSVALSPRANYTNWATATCRRNLKPTFVDRRVSRGQRGGFPTVVNLSFLYRSRYFSFK